MLWLCIIPAAFFFPVFFQDKTFYAFDALKYYLPWSTLYSDLHANNSLITDPVHCFFPPLFYPSHLFYQQSIAEGTLNLWTGSNFCGVPYSYYGHPAFYFFFSLFPLTLAHDLLLFFHLCGTGIFTYMYITRIGLKSKSAIIGSISWMLNGHVMVWFEFEHLPMMAFSLSATLYFIEVYLDKRSIWAFLALACSIAAALGTSYAHLVIYQMIFIGTYLVYRWAVQMRKTKGHKRDSFRPFASIVLSIFLGIVLSAHFFTSHIWILKQSQRKPYPFSQLYQQTGQLPVKYLSTILFPDFFGSPTANLVFTPRVHTSQRYNNYTELCIYLGIMTLFLACASIPFLGKRKFIGFFVSAAAVSLTMAMGSILYYPLAKFVPGLNLTTPTRILYLFGFCMSILSALGAELIQTNDVEQKAPITVIWVLLLLAAFVVVWVTRTDNGLKWIASSLNFNNLAPPLESLRSHYSLFSLTMLKPLLIISATAAILLAALYCTKATYKQNLLLLGILLLSYDLGSFGRQYNTASPRHMEYPSTSAINFLQQDPSQFRVMTIGRFLHNGFIPFGIEDISGYGSLYPERYGEYLHLSQYGKEKEFPKIFSRWITLKKFGSPLIDLINTKYVLLPSSMETDFPQLKPVYSGEITIFKNQNVFPRAFFVQKFIYAENAREAYELLGTFTRKDFKNSAILESLPPVEWTNTGEPSVPGGSRPFVKTLSYEPNRLEFEVKSSTKGFLVISDNFHPDWTAAIDGIPAPVLKANYIMRAVPVSAGHHKITLMFKPKLLLTGLEVTFVGWGIMFSILGVCLVKSWITVAGKSKRLNWIR